MQNYYAITYQCVTIWTFLPTYKNFCVSFPVILTAHLGRMDLCSESVYLLWQIYFWTEFWSLASVVSCTKHVEQLCAYIRRIMWSHQNETVHFSFVVVFLYVNTLLSLVLSVCLYLLICQRAEEYKVKCNFYCSVFWCLSTQ